MQRYAQGLEVPRVQIETFVGETSDAAGFLLLDLKHTPVSINNILVSIGYEAAPKAWNMFINDLTGRRVTLQITNPKYYRATGTATANSGNVGADPHSHTITQEFIPVHVPLAASEPLPVITLAYEVA